METYRTFPNAQSADGTLEITTDRMPADINRFIARTIKAQGLPVVGTRAQLLIASEPGRTWIKEAAQSSCTAHG